MKDKTKPHYCAQSKWHLLQSDGAHLLGLYRLWIPLNRSLKRFSLEDHFSASKGIAFWWQNILTNKARKSHNILMKVHHCLKSIVCFETAAGQPYLCSLYN